MKPKKVHWFIEAQAGRLNWQYDFSALTPNELKEGQRIAEKSLGREPLTGDELEAMTAIAAKTIKIPNTYDPTKKKDPRRTARK